MDGPAGGRPCMSAPAVLPVRRKFMITSSACACRMDGAWKYSPAAAVPVRMKIPEPMMAPMPSAVSDQGPRVFCSRWPGASDSAISLSIDLQQKSWLSEVRTVAAGSGGDCDKWWLSPEGLSAIRDSGKSPPFPKSGKDGAPVYRFDWPRANFFTLRFFDPRA